MNQGMPERFQRSDVELLLRMMRYDATPKRLLLKELYCTWRALGIQLPRGYTFPPLSIGKKNVQLMLDLYSMIKDGMTPEDAVAALMA
jgi:hypothetical protein